MDEIVTAATARGLKIVIGTEGNALGDADVVIANGFGQLGLWYRLAEFALIGGTFCDVEGHNPWEAVNLKCPVLHGPRIANFGLDYALLDQSSGASAITKPKDISPWTAARSPSKHRTQRH
jgi:3-deoxy-D-manno-octulosonic-acid transferase